MLAQLVPYTRCFEDEGIIETTPCNFTKMYMISDINPEDLKNYDVKAEEQYLKDLICSFDDDISFQFVIRNELIDKDAYLKKILIAGESDYPDIAKQYNRVVFDMFDIGHNNIRKVAFFVLSMKRDVVDDAINDFRKIDPVVREKFKQLYNLEAKGLTLTARLKVMYSMFNPGKHDFGHEIDLDNTGNIDLKNLKYMKMTTKDLIAPKSWDVMGSGRTPLVDYAVINKGTKNEIYMRPFFLNTVPEVISHSVISDFSSVSSDMILSITYQPVNANLGLDLAAKNVKDNTNVVVKDKYDTIEDRKKHAKEIIKSMKNETEESYFNKEALECFKDTVASNNKDFLCTITIVLYAPTLDMLDRDTSLLKISATKFACSVKSLDMQQKEGLQTSLPLCTPRINATRLLPSNQLAQMNPIDLQAVVKKGGLYQGLNTINSNLILLNRKNNVNYSGLIAGSAHSGKTFQMKRELVNAAISSKDKLYVVTDNDDYDDLAKTLGGKIVDDFSSNIFEMEEGYGLIDSPQIFKSYYVDALVTSILADKSFLTKSKEEAEEKKENDIEEEVVNFIKNLGDEEPVQYLLDNKETYPNLAEAIGKLPSKYLSAEPSIEDARLVVYKVKTDTDLIALMDKLWNMNIKDKKNNINDWVFFDNIDPLLYTTQTAYYLSEYISKMDALKTVTTYLIQDSAKVFLDGNEKVALAVKDICNSVGYIKLLTLGPVERRKYVEYLNIPDVLVSYITNAGQGKGLIITAAGDIAFDDSFPDDNSKDDTLKIEKEFKKLFSKEVVQILK